MFEIESQVAGGAVFRSGQRFLRVQFVAEGIARVTMTADKPFTQRASRIVVAEPEPVSFEIVKDDLEIGLLSSELHVVLNKATGALRYLRPDGSVLTREPEHGGKWLTPKMLTRNVFDPNATVEFAQSIDGARAAATSYVTVEDRTAFEAKLEFCFSPDEALFGLGSHEEGFANLRGRSRELYQQNMKAVVPHLVSTRGYSVLLDCGSLMTFHDDALGSYWWAEAVEELDFYFIVGSQFDELIRRYRRLTGTPPVPPKWAFGYVQSKERYVTAEEMLGVVREYRRREIPLDVIVLDWKSWPNGGGWGQKSFDHTRFPDPQAWTDALHELGAKLMVSIWPIMTGGCEDQRELVDRGLMLGNASTYNAFLPEARKAYWDQAQRGLFAFGVDAWWCDCTEPFEADWSGAVKPEPHARLLLNTSESKLYLDAAEINLYSLLHSQGIYEGQRATTNEKRVLNLTRSSYAGQSRYGTVTWNGDISGTWETLRRSIAEGINFCATGEPYWTVDAGGFFLDYREDLWFWRGDFPGGTRGLTDMNALEPDADDSGCTDLGFHELYTRWVQYAAFLPMFRSHGTDAAREIWRFGEEGSPFYDALAAAIRLRYRMMPYIYSLAGAVTFEDRSMLYAPALLFPEDVRTHAITDEFLFGPALLVCPVTVPMLYGPGSRVLTDALQTREVYLPAGVNWYEFTSGKLYSGGQAVVVEAPLDRIPVFARAGSIVPLTEVMQYVAEKPDAPWELRVHAGSDVEFTLFEDSGDGYGYEHGECSRVRLAWNEARRTFTMAAREGRFPGMTERRACRVVLQDAAGVTERSLEYTGREVIVEFGSHA